MYLIAVLDGCDSQGGQSPLPTLDYLCCDVTALMCSDVLGMGGGIPPRPLCIKRSHLSTIRSIVAVLIRCMESSFNTPKSLNPGASILP